MFTTTIANAAKRTFYKTVFNAKKNSPLICLVSAGVLGAMAIVHTYKATKKSAPIIEAHNKTVEEIHELVRNNPEQHTPKDERKMLTMAYASTGLKLAKAWAPVIVCSVSAVTLAGFSYKIQNDRNAYLSGALAIAERKLQTYQLKEKFEEETGKKYDDLDDADKKKFEQVVPYHNEFFDHFFGEGDKIFGDVDIYGPRHNPIVLEQTQTYFNKILPIRGVIFMNDICSHMGWPCTIEGQHAGWIYDPAKGDEQISFGIHDPSNSEMIAFMNGENTTGCWLHFNCETYITDRAIPKLNAMREFYRKRNKS